jgi:tetratricopeptide (TPR) repeat protein
MDSQTGKYQYVLICIILMSVTFAVYWPVRNYEFVKYDDDGYVTNNRHIRSGLTWYGVEWAFTSGYMSNWHPVAWLSHMLDLQFFGLASGRHHLVNLLIHTINTLLLFIVLERATGALWASAFVAAFFGLHPLHVESVAWVSERKDVLSAFFWLLTMWAYVRYAERPGILRYLAALAFFAIGLMAKPMLVTLPFVMLLLDYWPLNRLKPADSVERVADRKGESEIHYTPNAIRYTLLEKVPFFALSAVSSVVTFLVQKSGGAVSPVEVIDVKSRIGNAVVSYVGYIQKMIWPVRLAVFYPHPGGRLTILQIVIAALILTAVTVMIFRLARGRKYIFVGWLWYLGTLVPVIGLVQVGTQAMADRYTYIPLTGLFIIIAWGVRSLIARRFYLKVVSALLAVAILSAAAVCTRMQLKYWQNSIVLFERALAVSGDNYFIHTNYGYALKGAGRTDEAIREFIRSAQLNPNQAGMHCNLATVLKEAGRIDEAVEQFNIALALKPDSAQIYNNVGNILVSLGRVDEAIEYYKKALSLSPKFAESHYNLAVAMGKRGKSEDAIGEYRETLRLEPDNVDAMSNLGFELAGKGKFGEAIEYYKKAVRLETDNVIIHGRLGLALAGLNRTDEAIREFEIVLASRPTDAEMHRNIGVLLERQGKTDEAIVRYQRALQICPNDVKTGELLKAVLSKRKNR